LGGSGFIGFFLAKKLIVEGHQLTLMANLSRGRRDQWFSTFDASTEETYKILRVGGYFEQTIKNVQDFLKIKLEKKAHYLRARVSMVAQEENTHENFFLSSGKTKKESI
jgi:hypothetical protein